MKIDRFPIFFCLKATENDVPHILSPVYTMTFWARLALGTVPLFLGTALHVYTYLFAVPV